MGYKEGKGNFKHGHSSGGKMTKIYSTWFEIKKRCLNKNCKKYPMYGGRGIKVCKRWMKFENFYKDMGDPPTEFHSIDRINNNGHYEPSNCRWSTAKQQAMNRRSTVFLTHKGETLPVKVWCERLGVRPGLVYGRIFSGWSVEESVFTPPRIKS
jgi:hypothetical protein